MTDAPASASARRDLPPVMAGLAAQQRAASILAGSVAAPVHAYLFLGPPGTGRRESAVAFAAALVCPNGGCGDCPACRDTLAGRHPDVTVVERTGASILVEDARAVVSLAQRGPVAAPRQVIVLTDFQLVGQAAPVLLKTLEEPPETTVFVVLAESVSPGLVTIASRCVEVEFVPLDVTSLEAALVGEGIAPDVALGAAAAAGGRLDRARLLARDPGFASRQARWRDLPGRLDGTGATVSSLVGEILASADELVEVARERQREEIEAATAAAERDGERRLAGRQAIEDRHKREQRRVRVDELRAGLAALAAAYRVRLVAEGTSPRRVATAARAISAIDAAAGSLARNPNETLLLEVLLLELDATS
jgi:DNA polymerase-3 subunit delta'